MTDLRSIYPFVFFRFYTLLFPVHSLLNLTRCVLIDFLAHFIKFASHRMCICQACTVISNPRRKGGSIEEGVGSKATVNELESTTKAFAKLHVQQLKTSSLTLAHFIQYYARSL